jgi:hypothetical protein
LFIALLRHPANCEQHLSSNLRKSPAMLREASTQRSTRLQMR